MAKINVLGFEIANLIAAGEVVDRPASAVKELCENSLDAGATFITVEIRRGGIGMIRVSDNGCGMEPDDVPLAVLRHATSKISSAADLAAICTLGFRGEALAAISSVSHMKILTRTSDADMGTSLVCDGGEITEYSEAGCAAGTTVIATELFYNVPARRKFMKKDSTEAAAVSAVVEKLALSSPDVSFKFISDGEVKFVTPGNGSLFGAAYVIFGRECAERLVEVSRCEDGISVTGYTSEPDLVRSNRNMEYFFINGRYIRSRTISAAVEQAYASRIPKERFPIAVLNIEITPGLVDVNVHPSKLEVKFTNERLIFEAVYYAVLGTLTKRADMPEIKVEPAIPAAREEKPAQSPAPYVQTSHPAQPEPTPTRSAPITQEKHEYAAPGAMDTASSGASDMREQATPPTPREAPGRADDVQIPFNSSSWVSAEDAAKLKNPFGSEKSEQIHMPRVPTIKPESNEPDQSADHADSPSDASLPGSDAPQAADSVPEYRIIGEAYNCYVIVELEDRLVFIDKHAAHERIIYDSLCEKLRGGREAGQLLLFPLKEKLASIEADILEDAEYRESFERLGFKYTVDRAAGTVSISAVPEEIGRDGAADMLLSLAGRLSEGHGTIDAAGIEYFEQKLHQVACKAAIKGGRVYGGEEVRYICEKLLRTPEKGGSAVKTCPHGRPVAFELRKNSIERQFSRIV